MNAQQLIKRLSTLKSQRQIHEATWRQCYKYCAPDRMPALNDASGQSLEQDRKTARSDLFDTTAVDGIQLLTSSIISGVTPASSKWFKAVPSGLDKGSELTEGEQWLDDVSTFMHKNIHASNYDSEIADAVTDLLVCGHTILYVDQKENGGLVFNTWDVASCYISSTQANGIIDIVFKEYELSATQLVSEYGINNVSDKVKTALEKNPDQKFSLLHAIFPRDKEQIKGEEGKRMATAMPFASVTLEVQSKHIIKNSGYESFPCIVGRFRKLPNSHYGSGIASLVLPDAISCNQIMKLSLQSAELNLLGIYTAQHDGVINPHTLRIKPGAIIALNSVDALKRLDSGSATVGLGLDFVVHLQNKIRKALLSDQLTQPSQSPLSATEVSARVQLYRQQLGSIFGRMNAELATGILNRTWDLVMRSGVLPPAPEELKQANSISFQFTNGMAAAAKLEQVTAVQNLMINVAQMAQIDPTVMDNVNLDHAVQICGDGLGVPLDVLRTEEEIAQLRQAKQEQQQAMQEQQQQQALMSQVGQTGLDIAKDQAKNMTASELGEVFGQ